jgi:hypothetical protein
MTDQSMKKQRWRLIVRSFMKCVEGKRKIAAAERRFWAVPAPLCCRHTSHTSHEDPKITLVELPTLFNIMIRRSSS